MMSTIEAELYSNEPNALSGRLRAVIWILALFWAVNALWMVAAPQAWWGAVPGVGHTGAFNAHFVRDVGLTYGTVALSLVLGLLRPRILYPMLIVAAIWFVFHGGLHLWEIAAGRMSARHLLLDLPGVFAPMVIHPLLLLWAGRGRL